MRQSVSVVIPTFNRAAILAKTLAAYLRQDPSGAIAEILVVDDGSVDRTREIVEEIQANSPVTIHYHYQQNRGLASARNRAIRNAVGSLILFGDDDIVPGPTMIAEHLASHQRFPGTDVGILGRVAWAPEIKPTPFMEWAGLYGPQFQFGHFVPDAELDFRHAYFCNTSIKSEVLRNKELFSEDFCTYGWEDIEFSYRLYKEGWRMRYNANAVGFHYKYESFSQSLQRVEQVWRKTWPIYSATESGKYFAALYVRSNPPVRSGKIVWYQSCWSFAKVQIARFLRKFMDSRIRFPRRVYDFVWYHHSHILVDEALTKIAARNDDCETAKF